MPLGPRVSLIRFSTAFAKPNSNYLTPKKRVLLDYTFLMLEHPLQSRCQPRAQGARRLSSTPGASPIASRRSTIDRPPLQRTSRRPPLQVCLWLSPAFAPQAVSANHPQ